MSLTHLTHQIISRSHIKGACCGPRHNSVAVMERSSSSSSGGGSDTDSGWNLTHYVRGECTASFCPPHAAAACSPDPEAIGAQVRPTAY